MLPRGVILHTVGVKGDTTASAIRKYHVEHNGWKDIGYHRVIRKDGTVELGRSLLQPGAHTEGANDTWGICITGDGDSEAWTPAQRAAVIKLCVEWCHAKGWDSEKICGHREAPARLRAKPTHKTCPGKLVDMDSVRFAVSLALSGGAA